MRFLLTSPPLTTGLLALGICTVAFTPCPVFIQQANAQPANAKDNGSYGPIVTILTPEYSDVIKDVTAISIAITPRRYPAQSVELLVDGKAVSGVLPFQTKFKWDTKLFVDGPHTLGVRVTDTQGFIGQAETTIYINNNQKKDENSPILRWLGVENGQKLSGTTTIGLEAADNFGVKYVFLNVNSAISPDIKPPLASWMTNRPPYEFTLDTSRFDDGLYVLDAYAWDAMENERAAPRLTVGFYNHGTNPTVAPETSAQASKLGGTTQYAKTPEKSAPEKSAPAKALTGNQSAAPSTVSSSAPRLAQAPQGTVTTTENGWIRSEPVAQAEPTPGHSQRITTLASAKVTEPKIPSRGVPQNFPSADTKLSVPSSVASGVASVHSAAPAPRVAAAPQTRIENTESSAAPAGPNPKATLSGEATTSGRTQIATPPAASEGATRLAVAPEVRWTTPAEFRSPSTRPSNNAITTVSPLETPTSRSTLGASGGSAPLPSAWRSGFQSTAPSSPTRLAANTPATVTAPISQPVTRIQLNPRNANSEAGREANRATIAALPENDRARSSATTSQMGALDSRLTAIDNNQSSRLVFAAPYSPLRATNARTLPTVPRLAFSPDLSKPQAATPANAAITVALSPNAPVVHVSNHNDTLAAIAARYKMPVSAIASANGLKPNAQLVKGTKVLLPQALLVSYKGQAVTGDVAPLLIGSTSVAPFRFLFEKQGGKLDWNGAAKRVTARNGDYEVSIEIGSDKALVNEKEVLMDMAAFLLSGRTMVPVRFFEKALKAKVEWEPSTGRIFVAMTP